MLSSIIKKITFERVLSAFLCLLLAVPFFVKGVYNDDLFITFLPFIATLFLLFVFEHYKTAQGLFFFHKLDWAMLALLIAYSLSLISAVDIRSAIIGFMRLSACVLVFWMCYRASLRHSGYKALLYSFYWTGVIMSIFAVLIYCGIVPYNNASLDRLYGNFDYPNTLGAYVGVIFLLGWGLILSTQNYVTRAFISGGNAVLLLCLLGSLSRGAWLLLPIAVIAYFITIKPEQRLSASLALIITAIPGVLGTVLLLSSGHKTVSFIYTILAFLLAAGLQWATDHIYNKVKIKINSKKMVLGLVSAVLVLSLLAVLFIPSVKNLFTGSLGRLTNISLQDNNTQARIMFTRDAFKIVKDHPIIGVGSGGWNALYHQYAPMLYWSDKTHNYFLQTWLETGTIGFIALIAIWLLFCQLVWKYRKREDDDENASFLGAALACFYLGAHSIIDFDMSFSAIAFLLFGLMGALQGRSEKTIDGPIPISSAHPRKDKKDRKQLQEQRSKWKSKVIPGMTLASIAAFVLIVYASCLITASANYQKVINIMNKNPNEGIVYLNQAIKLDSLNAYYQCTAASYYVAVYKSTNRLQDYNLALASCKKAEELSPYIIQVLNDINKSYEELGEYDRCIEVADKLTRINPWDPNGYASLSKLQVIGGISCMMKQQQLRQADEYWLAATKTADRVPANIVVPPAGLNCTSGQALLLLGRTNEGELLLRRMLTEQAKFTAEYNEETYLEQVESFQKTARVWLIASLENSGKLDEAGKLTEEIPQANQTEAKNSVNSCKSYLNTAASLRAKNR